MKRKHALTYVAMDYSRWPNDRTINESEPPKEWSWLYYGKGWILHKSGKKPITRQHYLKKRERLIAKPSWKDAPEWATHLDQRNDGWWRWSKRETDGRIIKAYTIGGGKIPAGHDYTKTLEARPPAPLKYINYRSIPSVLVVPPSPSVETTVNDALVHIGLKQYRKTHIPHLPSGVRMQAMVVCDTIERMIVAGYRKP